MHYTAELLSGNDIDPEKWDAFVVRSEMGSIYSESWYMQIIAPGWKAIVVSGDGEWEAIMPLSFSRKFGVLYSLQPIFAQYWGIIFRNTHDTTNRIAERNKSVLEEIHKILPESITLFNYNFSPSFRYFLPFFWNNYNINPRLNYVLKCANTPDEMLKSYSKRIRNDLQKAKKNGLDCRESEDLNDIAKLCVEQRILHVDQSAVLLKIWNAVKERKRGFCLKVYDESGNLQCGGLFLIYRNKLIYSTSATAAEFKRTGCTSLMIHSAIMRACKDPGLNEFDFEGSMIEPIEHYFRGFNPEPEIYYQIEKNKLGFLFRLYQKLNSLRKK
ncbi:MAG: hypothetical protein GC181_09020 [Bacteroidetes bacterium]|nr:hypothetical protein [Bacteroidota bacterium]